MARKKSFTDIQPRSEDNPALAFISKESIEAVDGETVQTAPQHKGEIEPPPEGYRVNPLYLEKKSQRVQVILQPSLYQKAKAASKEEKISFNELVHKALRAYLNESEG